MHYLVHADCDGWGVCVQVLLTYDGNFRLRAKGYGIEVAKFGPGDSATMVPSGRKELLERFFPDVIPSPEQVHMPPLCGPLWHRGSLAMHCKQCSLLWLTCRLLWLTCKLTGCER